MATSQQARPIFPPIRIDACRRTRSDDLLFWKSSGGEPAMSIIEMNIFF
jgi:hypothetical protein